MSESSIATPQSESVSTPLSQHPSDGFSATQIAPEESNQAREILLSQAEQLGQLGCFVWNIAENTVRWSNGLYQLFGLTPQEFPATLEGFLERVIPEDREAVLQTIQTAIANCGSYFNVERIRHSSGDIRMLESRGEVLTDAQGRPQKLVGVCRDVTRRQEGIVARELQIKGLKLLAESASLIMVNRDERQWESLFLELASHLGCDAYANCNLKDGRLKLVAIHGLPEEAAKQFEDLELGQGMCGTCAQSRKFLYVPAEELEHHPQGPPLWNLGFRLCVAVPLIADSCLLGTLTFASRMRTSMHPWELDFIQTVGQLVAAAKSQKYFENQIRESEQRFRSLVENSADSLVLHDLNGVILDVNRATCEMLGYDRRELISLDMREIVASLPVDISNGYHNLVEHPPRLIEGKYRRKDGTQFTVEVRLNLIDFHGEQAILSTARDTTERYAAEREKRRAEETSRLILEQTNTVTWEANPKSLQFTFLSGSCETLLGYSVETWREPGFWFSRIHPGDLANVEANLRKASSNCQRFDFRMKHANGQNVWIEVCFEAQIEDGCLTLLRGVMSDITSRKLMEDRLRHSQKMEAIGRLAGGVAHDFNNLLTVISTSTELMLMRGGQDMDNLDALKAIQDTVERAQGLTSQLLMFGRNSMNRREHLDINQVVQGTERLLRRLIGEDIRLTTRLTANLPSIFVDPSHLDQVIVNLAVNARDAMPKGGSLHLETSLQTICESDTPHINLPSGDYVKMTVIDTGCGMSEEISAKIFEPFFTTKQVGQGSGLGLSVAYGVIREAGGEILVNSAPNEGTTFHILLPAAKTSRPHLKPSAINSAFRGTEKILLVEDETSVRNVATTALKMFGYQVVEASSGVEAGNVAASIGGEFAMLITDLVMPGIGGIELANRLREKYPHIEVLCLSGYSETMISDQQISYAFLSKPFTIQQLMGKVREILDRRTAKSACDSATAQA